MCQLLLSMRSEVAGSAVLELGCGAGGVGIYSAALGAQRVLLTDGGQGECDLATLNVRRHKYLYSRGASVRSMLFLWGEPVDALMAGGGFDFVVGADITYSVPLLPPLCDTFAALSEASSARDAPPTMLLSHQINREGESDIPKLLALVASGRGLHVSRLEIPSFVAATHPNVAFYAIQKGGHVSAGSAP